jgi:hypothetical protein
LVAACSSSRPLLTFFSITRLGFWIKDRLSQVNLMAEFQEELGFALGDARGRLATK